MAHRSSITLQPLAQWQGGLKTSPEGSFVEDAEAATASNHVAGANGLHQSIVVFWLLAARPPQPAGETHLIVTNCVEQLKTEVYEITVFNE